MKILIKTNKLLEQMMKRMERERVISTEERRGYNFKHNIKFKINTEHHYARALEISAKWTITGRNKSLHRISQRKRKPEYVLNIRNLKSTHRANYNKVRCRNPGAVFVRCFLTNLASDKLCQFADKGTYCSTQTRRLRY